MFHMFLPMSNLSPQPLIASPPCCKPGAAMLFPRWGCLFGFWQKMTQASVIVCIAAGGTFWERVGTSHIQPVIHCPRGGEGMTDWFFPAVSWMWRKI